MENGLFPFKQAHPTKALILPGTGRGTARRVVEGAGGLVELWRGRCPRQGPSTTLRVVPLLVAGRITLQLAHQFGHGGEQVGHQAQVGDLEDRGVFVLVDGDDGL